MFLNLKYHVELKIDFIFKRIKLESDQQIINDRVQ